MAPLTHLTRDRTLSSDKSNASSPQSSRMREKGVRRGSFVSGRKRGRRVIYLNSEGTMAVGSHEEQVSHLRVTVLQTAPLLGRRELPTSHLHPSDFRFSFYVFVPVTTQLTTHRVCLGLRLTFASLTLIYLFYLIHTHSSFFFPVSHNSHLPGQVEEGALVLGRWDAQCLAE